MYGNTRVIIKSLPHLLLVLNYPLNIKSFFNSDLCRFVAFSSTTIFCFFCLTTTSFCRHLLFFRNTSLSGIGSWRAAQKSSTAPLVPATLISLSHESCPGYSCHTTLYLLPASDISEGGPGSEQKIEVLGSLFL